MKIADAKIIFSKSNFFYKLTYVSISILGEKQPFSCGIAGISNEIKEIICKIIVEK